ncbi:GNAT family N-acetyltransferase [Bacillus sp. FJAT-45350]|uniref:GNAT family N-acetyltransferase n=1 Tax=Bacillus sp. FJAT-45350 TaxID=2011014 RepID=UPI0015CBDA0C|nr:GNAT family N-acetyltransferase [Bacillus sp. FJAT-45350]
MSIRLEKLTEQDGQSLFAFEKQNRSFFETMVPSRGDEYYIYENFERGLKALVEEQLEGTSLFYLIKDESNLILGRMNVVDIEKEDQSGSIGYRIGEAFLKKGIASKALAILLHEAKEHKIKQLYAKTTIENVGSQKVLEKNGFLQIGKVDSNGITFIQYELSSN